MTWSILNFCISECKPFAAVTFSIFSLQWQFSPLTFYSSSSLMALTVTFCEKFWSLLSKGCIWSFAFYYYKINKCTEYCRFVPRENLTWCHLVFCEHPISLPAPYSNYLFGGTLFLNTSLDIETVWNLQKSNPATAGAHNVNRKLQYYDGKCSVDGLQLVLV